MELGLWSRCGSWGLSHFAQFVLISTCISCQELVTCVSGLVEYSLFGFKCIYNYLHLHSLLGGITVDFLEAFWRLFCPLFWSSKLSLTESGFNCERSIAKMFLMEFWCQLHIVEFQSKVVWQYYNLFRWLSGTIPIIQPRYNLTVCSIYARCCPWWAWLSHSISSLNLW